jgi:p-aminobenzoyl-glutamate transporter AbgT
MAQTTRAVSEGMQKLRQQQPAAAMATCVIIRKMAAQIPSSAAADLDDEPWTTLMPPVSRNITNAITVAILYYHAAYGAQCTHVRDAREIKATIDRSRVVHVQFNYLTEQIDRW